MEFLWRGKEFADIASVIISVEKKMIRRPAPLTGLARTGDLRSMLEGHRRHPWSRGRTCSRVDESVVMS